MSESQFPLQLMVAYEDGKIDVSLHIDLDSIFEMVSNIKEKLVMVTFCRNPKYDDAFTSDAIKSIKKHFDEKTS